MSLRSTQSRLRLGLVLSLLTLALFGCRGQDAAIVRMSHLPEKPEAGAVSSGEQLAGMLAQLLPVRMQPQAPLAAPAVPVALASPEQCLALLSRSGSASGAGCSGAAFAPDLPHPGVTPAGVTAVFNPADADTGWSWCVYPIEVVESAEAATIEFTWAYPEGSCPLCQGSRPDFRVGLRNADAAGWEWYLGPRDDVLTLSQPVAPRAVDGMLLVAIAVAPTGPAVLERISLGPAERRAAGMISFSAEEIALARAKGVLAAPRVASDLPPVVDLTGECSYIRDQGSIQSCGAFTVGDGAYNFELNQIYGQYGWDFNSTLFAISPKYLYRNTPGNCPDGYRGFTDILNWTLLHGAATEYNCPYVNVCAYDWGQPATDDAAVLRIDSWDWVYWNPNQGLDGIKTILADEQRPVMMRTELDAAFDEYAPGEVWDYAGPSVAGHGMVVVGYDDAQSAFHVRNSWGNDWGDGGYLWIGYATFLNPDANVACCKLIDSYNPAVMQRFLVYVTNVAPSRCTTGALLTITGVNFGAARGGSYVEFQPGVQPAAEDYVAWSNTSIQVNVPAAAISGAVKVHVGTKSSNNAALTVVLPAPKLQGLDQM